MDLREYEQIKYKPEIRDLVSQIEEEKKHLSSLTAYLLDCANFISILSYTKPSGMKKPIDEEKERIESLCYYTREADVTKLEIELSEKKIAYYVKNIEMYLAR